MGVERYTLPVYGNVLAVVIVVPLLAGYVASGLRCLALGWVRLGWAGLDWVGLRYYLALGRLTYRGKMWIFIDESKLLTVVKLYREELCRSKKR